VEDKIKIVNWFLTRKCNFKCSYCGIIRERKGVYPSMEYFYNNEVPSNIIISTLSKIKKHNSKCFHIFYGGEPLLREDLSEIIKFCNENDIYYTIISNCFYKFVLYDLLDKVGYIRGFTASIDKYIKNDDEYFGSYEENKSFHGLETLINLPNIKDRVAEITITPRTDLENICELIEVLSANEIYSDITFVDIAKNTYYDFSNVRDKWELVYKNKDLQNFFSFLKDKKYIHMKDILLPVMWDSLPSNFDCMLSKKLHNISIDADGAIRLCSRIRGIHAPSKFNVSNFIDDEGNISKGLHIAMIKDKGMVCELCNHTCQMMSYFDSENDLLHTVVKKITHSTDLFQSA